MTPIDPPVVIAETVISTVIDFVATRILDRLTATPVSQVEVMRDNMRESIRQHLSLVSGWASDLSLRDSIQPRTMAAHFVNIDLHLGVERSRSASQTSLRVSDLATAHGHTVLLGDPGAGKSTSLKRVAAADLDRIQAAPDGPFTILVRLRDFADTETLAAYVIRLFAVTIKYREDSNAEQQKQERLTRTVQILESGCSILLLDGLDEVHPRTRDRVVSELRTLCLTLRSCRVILTCRSADWQVHLENARTFTLEPLSEGQIRQFAIRWLGSDTASKFMQSVRMSPYAGAEVRPLTLAQLCTLFERTGSIPDRPKTVHRKIVRLLLDEWNEQNSVRRHTEYAGFEVDRKEEFLEALAFHISMNHGRSSFGEAELVSAYNSIHSSFGLPAAEATRVAREIESHTGLVIQSGYGTYEFTHKSIHEYLTANFVTKLPALPVQVLADLPNEAAVAVALSSSPSQYFIAIASQVSVDGYTALSEFAEPFVGRIIIEKVDFVQSIALAAAFLRLYALSYWPDKLQLELPFRVPSRAMTTLAASDVFAASIREYLLGCSATDSHGDLVRVLPQGADRRRFDLEHGFYLDRKLFSILATAKPHPIVDRFTSQLSGTNEMD